MSSLVTAWRNLAAYPPGHPARASALATAHTRLRASLAVASPLVLGISRDALVSGGKKIEASHVRAFARALYRRNGGVLRFEEGVEPRELETFLALLGDTGPARDRALTVEELRAAGITNIHVSAIDYSALVTTSDLDEPGGDDGSLWDGLLQTLLAGQPVLGGGMALERERYSAETIASLFRGGPGVGGPGPGGPGSEGTPGPGGGPGAGTGSGGPVGGGPGGGRPGGGGPGRSGSTGGGSAGSGSTGRGGGWTQASPAGGGSRWRRRSSS